MIRVFVPPHMSIYCIAESSKVSAEAVGTSRVIQCSSGIVKQMCHGFCFPTAVVVIISHDRVQCNVAPTRTAKEEREQHVDGCTLLHRRLRGQHRDTLDTGT